MVEVPEVTNSLNDIKDSLDFWKMLKELWEPKYLVESISIKLVLSSQKFCSHRGTIYFFLLNNMDLATNVLSLLDFYMINAKWTGTYVVPLYSIWALRALSITSLIHLVSHTHSYSATFAEHLDFRVAVAREVEQII